MAIVHEKESSLRVPAGLAGEDFVRYFANELFGDYDDFEWDEDRFEHFEVTKNDVIYHVIIGGPLDQNCERFSYYYASRPINAGPKMNNFLDELFKFLRGETYKPQYQ